MSYNYVVFDMDKLREELGSHYDPLYEDTYFEICPDCGARVYQDQNRCECGKLVVWDNSQIWRNKFEMTAAQAIRMLRTVVPIDSAGRMACDLAGVDGFSNQAEADRWRRHTSKLGVSKMKELIRSVSETTSGRGIISYVLNWSGKIIRDQAKGPVVIDLTDKLRGDA